MCRDILCDKTLKKYFSTNSIGTLGTFFFNFYCKDFKKMALKINFRVADINQRAC